jgi:hypothetical protein
MKCKALTKSFQTCGVPALHGEEFCLFHSSSERAKEYRRRAHEPGTGYVSRREMLRQLTRDFRDLDGKTDAKSKAARLRLVPLLTSLINEQTQLSKLKRLAKEKGLI